jgi:nicotinate phosphoribosyltransferase
MAASYLRRGMTDRATFSLFVRDLPADRGFLVAAGLEACLEWLEGLRFGEDDLAYLARLGFDDQALGALADLRFTGDVWAVPEGHVVFALEPLLEVTAPIAEAQVVETLLLNQITMHTALASKAARCVIAAAGRVDLVEFGFRRAQGVDAAATTARSAALVGFVATSNVEAARRFGLRPTGTMAHSFVEAFPTEGEAFRAYAEDHPRGVTFLVDTYDTLDGVANAMEVIDELGLGHDAAVRIDSGDLDGAARATRAALDGAGLTDVRIFVSGGLDEHDVARLVSAGAPIDAVGLGTRLAVSADAPYLDTAYKLVAYGERPVMKLSPGKASLPGAKQVFRGHGCADVIGLRTEPPTPGTVPLLHQVMRAGTRTEPPTTLDAARARFHADLAALPDDVRRLARPAAPVPALTTALRQLATTVEADARGVGRT